MQEVSLDGVIYARFEHNGQTWLLGSTNPSWKALVGTLQAVPDEADLIHLAWAGRPILQAGCYVLWSGFRLARDGQKSL